MWFRNLQIYRLQPGWAMTEEKLAEQLARLEFTPCGSQDPASRGWVSAVADAPLVHSVGGQWLLSLCEEQRLLPGSVVRQELTDRAEALGETQGFKPGRKQLAELKDLIVQELMPRAFTRRRRCHGWIDPVNGYLVIDAGSKKGAESFIETLLKTVDNVPLKMLDTEQSPSAVMTEWLASNEAPAGFTVDMDCELRAIGEEKSAVRYVRHSLEGKEIREHIAEGKQVTRLALTYADRVSLVLTEQLEVKRLDFLDVVRDAAGEGLDQAERFNADFSLMTGELQNLIPALIEILGGERKTAGV